MAERKRTNKVEQTNTAAGIPLPVKVPLLAQLGSTGLKEFSGYISEEFLSQLRGREAIRVYTEMADNDPIVGAMVYAIQMLLRQAEWRVDPKDESSKAEEAKEFVEQCMEDMSHSWAEFIEEVTTMIPYGYSLFETVFKIRGGWQTDDPQRKSKFDDGRVGIRKLGPRSQDSVLRWLFDAETGAWAGVEQLTVTGHHALIPADRLLLFRTISKKDNPEGRSVLRNSYVPYIRKKSIEDAEGRAALRAAGIVELRIPGRMMSPEADDQEQAVYSSFKQLATTLSRDQQGAVILPSDKDDKGNPLYEFTYIMADGRRPTDFSQIIRRFDEAMATSILADFIMLGQSQGMHGSHALSTNKSDIFSQALNAYLKGIEEVLNRHLLPRLWELNSFDPDVMPQIKADTVEIPDLAALGQYIQLLTASGARMFPDENLEEHLREIAELPPVADTAQAQGPMNLAEQQSSAASDQIDQQAQHTQENAKLNAKLQPKLPNVATNRPTGKQQKKK